MKSIIRIAALIAAWVLQPALAGEGVGALGLSLGRATVEQLEQEARRLGSSATFTGMNKFTQGPMYSVPAQAFGVDGLESVTFIFDAQRTLAATTMTMAKHRFDAVFQHLRSKYAVREQRIPFVGDRYARLGAPGATIEVIAPHLSFQMDVLYQRDDFVAAYKRVMQSEAQQKANHERNQF